MDGRVQEPVIKYLKKRYNVPYVDSITEPGPIKILAGGTGIPVIENILFRIDISINKHRSRAIAVVGHHDCAGNPVGKTEQLEQIRRSLQFLKDKYPQVELVGLWVDENWSVSDTQIQ